MSKNVKLKKICSLKNCLIFLICFLVIMITPISAVQLSITGSHLSSDPNIKPDKYAKKSKNLKNNMLNILDSTIQPKTSTSSNVYKKCINTEEYSKQATIAGEILPIMKESYHNNSIGIKQTQNSSKELETKKIDTTKKLEKTKSELENFEVNSNNINEYNRLKKEYKDYQSLQKSIIITKSEINRMNGILNKKQTHTKKCITALKQIKKSENIKNAVNCYNNNMKSLEVISNNMALEIQQKKEIIKLSNSTSNVDMNETLNTTNSSDTDTSMVTDVLKYSGIGIGSLTGASCIATIASLVVYGVTTSNAVAALNAAGALSATYQTLVSHIFSTSQILAAQPTFLEWVAATKLADAAVATSEVAGMVPTVLIVVAVVLVIASIATMIAYFGFKNHWW